MRALAAGRRGARTARWKREAEIEMEGIEMKEAEMGNMEARTRSTLILVAFEVKLFLSCSMENHNIGILLVLYFGKSFKVCTPLITL